MFTGIIEATGKVASIGNGALTVASPLLAETPIGASIAINGVCLTVVEHDEDSARFDVVPETLDRTNLGELDTGEFVNLERAMSATGRFDGHVVQGHVDDVGEVSSIEEAAGRVTLTVIPPARLMAHIAEKGSITIDGVSLTVAAVTADSFQVALIPHTLESTTLGSVRTGDRVNLETDVIAKYTERILEARR